MSGDTQVSKIFRQLDDGKVEKCFVDHGAKPKRSYRTGEVYRPLTKDDGPPEPQEEDVIVYNTANFHPYRYRRVSPIDKCIFPKSFDDDDDYPGSHLDDDGKKED